MFSALVALPGDRFLEAVVEGPRAYRLRWGAPGDWRVVYEDGERRIDGKRRPYVFRSIEQLRYDFERDVEDARDPDRRPR
jgi:hypothetical protein